MNETSTTTLKKMVDELTEDIRQLIFINPAEADRLIATRLYIISILRDRLAL